MEILLPDGQWHHAVDGTYRRGPGGDAEGRFSFTERTVAGDVICSGPVSSVLATRESAKPAHQPAGAGFG